jgi:RNA polymerase sigma factor (sigma-70 family)
MTSDADLLRRHVREHSEAALAELVRRHVDLVYFAALRQLGGDTHAAQDVTQSVFTDLARKAVALAGRATVAGWLHTSTRFAAAKWRRAQAARQKYEQQAELMQDNFQPTSPAADWEQLRPMIDDAVHQLGERDREAVLLRFFAGHSYALIAATLGISEDAARMRVERALERLREVLQRRGVSSTGGALALAFANQASATAPAGLASAATSAALSGATAGSAASALILFTMSKIEIGIAGAIIVATAVLSTRPLLANRALRAEIAGVPAATADVDRLRAEQQELSREPLRAGGDSAATAEVLRLRARLAQLDARPRWVVEPKMKAVAALRDAGWSTDVAAVESFLHACVAGDETALAKSFAWTGEAKARAEAAFAQLSDVLRAKYGSPERLAATVLVNTGNQGAREPLVGYWADSDPDARFPRPGLTLRVRAWARYASGAERPLVIDLRYADGEWHVGASPLSAEAWQAIVARVDPTTGEVLPPKILPRRSP